MRREPVPLAEGEAVFWVKIDDRMPEMGVTILLCADGNCVFQGYLNAQKKWATEHGPFPDDEQHRITHWMPMPAPPRDDQQPCINRGCGNPRRKGFRFCDPCHDAFLEAIGQKPIGPT